MSEVHVFHASGDACPICAGLDGQVVEEGYSPHDGCLCQTAPQEQQGDCEWSFEHSGNARYGNGWADVVSGIEVTVICPDGSETGASTGFDGGSFSADSSDQGFDDWADAMEDAAEELAQQLCDQCAPEEPFLCC